MDIEYVSPSRLKIFNECSFKYFLSYYWHWRDELFQYTFASEFGSSIHETLEAYAKFRGKLDYQTRYKRNLIKNKTFFGDMSKAPSKARASFFSDKKCDTCIFNLNGKCVLTNKDISFFDGCPLSLYNDGLNILEKAINRYNKYFISGLKSDKNPNGKIIGIEAPANISWGLDNDGKDIIMNGFIDLLVEYDFDTLLVIDYKTGYSIPSYDECILDLQPRMYSYAVKKMFPNYKYYLVQFDYLRGSDPIEFVFTAEDDEKIRQEVIKLYNQIKLTKNLKRRAEDRYCKHMCNRPLCDILWAKLKNGEDGINSNKLINNEKED